jgi:transposase
LKTWNITCESFKIGLTTAYKWIHRWNEGGIESLQDRAISGRPAKLNEDQIDQLKEDLKGKNQNFLPEANKKNILINTN